MTNKNLYLDIHVIQTIPSANINRDDTGAPKTALYGGVTRARVSSQSWKRVIRQGFNAETSNQGIRTKMAAQLLVDELMNRDNSLAQEEAIAKVREIFSLTGVKLKKETNETGALLLISQGQINKLAQFIIDNDDFANKENKKDILKILTGTQSLDLGLFGRMVADNPELNVDASAQVAHAISTHEIVPEYDYFTALDDLQADENSGAAMLGSLEFNSATLYRYANINIKELINNMGVASAVTGIEMFVKEFLLSMPSGKQNTFANKTLPNYVMINIRTDTPVNLVSAFEEPVKSRSGYVEKSIEKFEKEFETSTQYVDKPETTVVLSKYLTNAGVTVNNISELLEKVVNSIKKVVQDEDVND